MNKNNATKPSKRVLAIAESTTLRLSAEIGRLRRDGQKIINLLEGESDLPTPGKIKALTIQALRGNQTRYSDLMGLPELKTLIAGKLRDENKIPMTEKNILVTHGAKQAIYGALQTLCNPGDEVIILSPYWVTFPEAARLAGAKPVFAQTIDGQPDLNKIIKALTRKTKGIIINTPNNPTGAVYSFETLKKIAQLAQRRDFFILSDEAYERLVFDGCRHLSIASVSRDAAKRTVTVQTFSKTYSMTGFRVGYLAADESVIKAVARLQGHMTGNICAFIQRGAAAALQLDKDYYPRFRAAFERRRDIAYEAATEIFDCVKPQGGFFVFPDVRRYLGKRFKSSSELAAHLLNEAHVAVVPGSACGMEGHLRISFSSSEENIRAGFASIKKTLCS